MLILAQRFVLYLDRAKGVRASLGNGHSQQSQNPFGKPLIYVETKAI